MAVTAEKPLADWPIAIRRHVKWGEMDAFGHVNNTAYFRYFEDVRIAHFEALGVMASMEKERKGPILASTQARFRAPLAYPDEVVIGSRIRDLQEDRFVMEYAVHSLRLGRIVCDGEGLIVYLDYSAHRKCPVPEAIRDRIDAENA